MLLLPSTWFGVDKSNPSCQDLRDGLVSAAAINHNNLHQIFRGERGGVCLLSKTIKAGAYLLPFIEGWDNNRDGQGLLVGQCRGVLVTE